MSTKYNKVVATIDGNAEVIYVTDAELERCRKRVGKEGCEDASIDNADTKQEPITVAQVWAMPRKERLSKQKVIFVK